MVKSIYVLMLLLSSSSTCASTDDRTGGNVFTIYYFPLDAETLTPVTTQNIESRGGRCFVRAENDVNRIKKIVASANRVKIQKHSFSDKRVRVKIVESKKGAETVISIESDGVVKQGDVIRMLSQEALGELKMLVEHFCRGV